MDVKVDMGFLMALMGLFSSDAIDRSQEVSVSCEIVPSCLLMPLFFFVFVFWGGGPMYIYIYIASRVVVRFVIPAFVLTTAYGMVIH